MHLASITTTLLPETGARRPKRSGAGNDALHPASASPHLAPRCGLDLVAGYKKAMDAQIQSLGRAPKKASLEVKVEKMNDVNEGFVE